jgi:antitoxin HicB
MTAAERPTSNAQVADYMRRSYPMEIVWDDDYWAATFPELPGLVAAADTWEELEAKIADAKESYFEAALEAGLPIAEPRHRVESASGRVLLRLPKTLHWQATRAAARDGVSVNTFLVSAVARELGRREARQVEPEPSPIEVEPLMARPSPKTGMALRHEILTLQQAVGRLLGSAAITPEDRDRVSELMRNLQTFLPSEDEPSKTPPPSSSSGDPFSRRRRFSKEERERWEGTD